jgi:L-alanine-DL-glutamate epimerase-like enolase superfamily enzyme
MKITRVECLILDQQFPFVKVHTDAGITGIGEIFRRNAPIYKAAVESALAPVLIGKDPLNTEALWQEMSRSGVAIDTRSSIYCAMAGIDIALWDIRGKAWGVPIYQLLGARCGTKFRCTLVLWPAP